jgi:hypothetical protein
VGLTDEPASLVGVGDVGDDRDPVDVRCGGLEGPRVSAADTLDLSISPEWQASISNNLFLAGIPSKRLSRSSYRIPFVDGFLKSMLYVPK